jgi:GMP synthase-like glutamine amidotransferase
MGGKVQKSENGWCAGVHEFEIFNKENWMSPFQSKVNLLMSCQDQILVLPPNSKVMAKSSLCPVGMIRIGNKMLGIQGHPEFSASYVKSLMLDRENRIGEETVKVGIESFKTIIDSELVAEWMNAFLNQSI